MSTDKLLDVFVGVQIADGTLQATQEALKTATENIKAMFASVQTQSAAAATNAVNLINNAAARSGGGRGRGGSGGGGGPGEPLSEEFEQARRHAQDLQRELAIVSRIIRATGAEELTSQLQQMSDFLRDITVTIGRQRADRDTLGVGRSLELLEEFEQRLRGLEGTGIGTLDLRRRFDASVAGAREEISQEKIRSRLAESLIRGTPSGDIRKRLLEAREILEAIENRIKKITSSFAGTEDQVQQLNATMGEFKVAAAGMRDIQNQAKAAGPSFNTLTNNAYQLGQAIEDFSVGFSLNGFAGGVRGAANNIAFILNNMVQADFIQGRLNEKWKNALPILFGVGSAVAITIVPAMIEWLAALDDIDHKFNDIKRTIDRISTDEGLEQSLNKDTESIREFARTATDVNDVIRKVIDLKRTMLTLEEEVNGTARALNRGGIFKSFSDDALAFDKQISAVIGKYRKQVEDLQFLGDKVPETFTIGGKEFNINDPLARHRFYLESDARSGFSFLGGGVSFTEEDIRKVKEQSAAVDGLSEKLLKAESAISKVKSESEDGIITVESIVAARDSVRGLQDTADQLSDPTSVLRSVIDVTDKTAKGFSETVNTLSGSLEEMAEKAKTNERAMSDMADAIQFSQSAMGRLLEDSRLELSVLQGTSTELAKLARDFQRTAEQQKRDIDDINLLVKVGKLDQTEADVAIRAAEENLQLNTRISILERMQEVKSQLKNSEEALVALSERANKNEQSRLTSLEAYTQQIQTNALSSFKAEEQQEKKRKESIKERAIEIQKARDDIDRLMEMFNAAGNPAALRQLSLRPADRFSVEPFGASKDQDFAKAWMEPILRKMVIEQERTEETIRIKDTTPRVR